MKLSYVGFFAAAAVVIAMVVFALRDPESQSQPQPVPVPDVATATESAPPPPATTAVPVPDESGEEPVVEIIDPADFNDLMRQYGISRLESEWRDWALGRGFPVPGGSDGYVLDQPYDQYDNETLRGLASNGDMWAQQILAKRISRTDPAEAIELYREAAIRGSIYAMSEMSNLYVRIADKRREVEFKSQEQALEQIYAMRDAPVAPEVTGYAWTAVAAMAGTEPMFGNIAASQLSRKLTDQQKEEACSIAGGMYDEILQRREALGLGDYDRRPPPIVYWDPNASRVCPDQDLSLDVSGCREVQMTEDGETNSIWLCGE